MSGPNAREQLLYELRQRFGSTNKLPGSRLLYDLEAAVVFTSATQRFTRVDAPSMGCDRPICGLSKDFRLLFASYGTSKRNPDSSRIETLKMYWLACSLR